MVRSSDAAVSRLSDICQPVLDPFLDDQPVTEMVTNNTEADVVWLHSYVTDTARRMFCHTRHEPGGHPAKAAHRTVCQSNNPSGHRARTPRRLCGAVNGRSDQ